ncbi:sulfatase-like hydrolase/transferase [Porticoccaceae bacterium]|nr:sulfatase-like hydrolase/transferase [Porticoccaceae bacterium]
MLKPDLLSVFLLSLLLLGCGGGSGGGGVSGNQITVSDPVVEDDSSNNSSHGSVSDQPNILLIIADDQGIDASAQYALSSDLPVTPTLNQLASNGIVFDNAWATPACTTTRSTMITGQYGINSGVLDVGDKLPADAVTLQQFLSSDENTDNYQSAVIGKWHLSGIPADTNHPSSVGVDYFAGNLRGAISDYAEWDLTINGETSVSTQYHSSAITDLAIDWIDDQTQPWFLWLAYVAPHSPFHLPPAGLHTQTLAGTEADIAANPRAYYLAAIEAMDTEIGRLLWAMTDAELSNTIILYIGDNGTPGRVVDRSVYGSGSKGSLMEGGLRVPMVVSGAGVSRQNVRESALINSSDFFATIANLAGSSVTAVEDSQSFKGLLSNAGSAQRDYVYSDFEGDSVSGWAVRGRQYKLITTLDGQQQLYDLVDDPLETNNLLATSSDYSTVVERLASVATIIRDTDASADGETLAIDITGELFTQRSANCEDYIASYQSTAMDLFRSVLFSGNLTISASAGKCRLQSNGVPNHDFNDGPQSFPNNLSEQNYNYQITDSPVFASSNTALAIGSDNGLMLNGVKIDLLAAACFAVGDEKTGCGDMSQPWRFDPMFPANGFRVDSHNAHVQPSGSYHYHGTPNAMFAANTAVESPLVGFAADGFPIFGSWFDDKGTVRKALPSYRLKSGARQAVSGYATPSGDYDGTYRDDYEYIENLGDLDECNGMQVNGVYGYFITDGYPYIMGCLKGRMDPSFN